jgi:hypothetical protein|uniref:Uncharacterized protein n=1 Tax=Attheya septentrionalis TaxID=420275 RepID=A0A7S2UR26_9STRA|mmetsp:Transcript_8850/g.16097  ORF Transcript_8850/g.16097 Transcript_8850/m.16097 type:complete len:201 (+) Transcript_8850:1252-1854(+)
MPAKLCCQSNGAVVPNVYSSESLEILKVDSFAKSIETRRMGVSRSTDVIPKRASHDFDNAGNISSALSIDTANTEPSSLASVSSSVKSVAQSCSMSIEEAERPEPSIFRQRDCVFSEDMEDLLTLKRSNPIYDSEEEEEESYIVTLSPSKKRRKSDPHAIMRLCSLADEDISIHSNNTTSLTWNDRIQESAGSIILPFSF